MNQELYQRIETELLERSDRSTWDKGITLYALELLETISETDEDINSIDDLNRATLNGAESWHDYSYGGCSLIYNEDICTRLCPPSEAKRSKYGDRNPNRYEEWLDVQTRALKQAYSRLSRIYRRLQK